MNYQELANENLFKHNFGICDELPPKNDPDDVNDNEDEIDYTKVFISEDLTRNRQFILWKARLAKKKHIIRDCWTTAGQILLKDNTNKIVPIQSLTQLCTKFPAIDVQ